MLDSNQSALHTDVRHTQTAVIDIRVEVAELRHQTQADIVGIKTDIVGLKGFRWL